MIEFKIKLKEETYKELEELTQLTLDIKFKNGQVKKKATIKDCTQLLNGLLGMKEFKQILEEWKKLGKELKDYDK